MDSNKVSRRELARVGVSAFTATALACMPAKSRAQEADDASRGDGSALFATGAQKSHLFLQSMMDAYAQGETPRLIQSYSDQMQLQSTSFVYDDAVVINALLERGDAASLQRARLLGRTLLYAQQNDSSGDGRVRQAYFVDRPDTNGVFLRPALAPFFFIGSATGDMSWVGMTLARLFARTGEQRFLDGAVRLGQWIVQNTFSTSGAGGFTAGVDAGNNALTYKSTEHNIDAFALFTMLAQLTGDSSWASRALHARTFVHAMFNGESDFFWTGTLGDGVAINTNPIPEDVNTWSFLALQDETFAGSVDWAKTNLAVTDTPQSFNNSVAGTKVRISGVTFTNFAQHPPVVNDDFAPSDPFSTPPNPSSVWLEGTAHVVTALRARNRSAELDLPGFGGDRNTASFLLLNILGAQATQGAGQSCAGKPLPPQAGIVAASSELNTGFGFSYKPFLHIGATGWFAIAAQARNPFRLRGW
ncbi:MAG TPA: hypothetical protein VI653_19900 [Steroidobacteraceae bacterium]